MKRKPLLAGLALMGVSGFLSAADPRPICDKKHVGRFWPAEADASVADFQRLARSGDLEICACTLRRRYRWEHLTISVEQLRKAKAKHKKNSFESSPTEAQ